ncbi:MAG TPA: hypothetical protein VF012_05785, partial [Nocardioidaceae bacterium]
VSRVLDAINEHLEEPIENCLALDANGKPCLEAKTPQDIDQALAMPGGHIFHGDLSWPWSPNRSRMDNAAQRWGVATDVDNVLLCGSGARRGGAVSGIGGHNAAKAVLEAEGAARSAQTEAAQTEAAQTEAAQTEAGQTEAAQTEAGQSKPGQTDGD